MALILALACLFCSCSQVEDARHVVAEADSLRAAGVAYSDSAAIADAAATLSYSETGIRTYKSRVNEKLGNKGHDLRNFLIENVILGASEEQKM